MEFIMFKGNVYIFVCLQSFEKPTFFSVTYLSSSFVFIHEAADVYSRRSCLPYSPFINTAVMKVSQLTNIEWNNSDSD